RRSGDAHPRALPDSQGAPVSPMKHAYLYATRSLALLACLLLAACASTPPPAPATATADIEEVQETAPAPPVESTREVISAVPGIDPAHELPTLPEGLRRMDGEVMPTQSELERVSGSVLKVTVTSQPWDYRRPWLKKGIGSRIGLGTVIEGGRVLVIAAL